MQFYKNEEDALWKMVGKKSIMHAVYNYGDVNPSRMHLIGKDWQILFLVEFCFY